MHYYLNGYFDLILIFRNEKFIIHCSVPGHDNNSHIFSITFGFVYDDVSGNACML